MNKTTAHIIRSRVLTTYGDITPAQEKEVLESRRFKAMYRAAKKNHNFFRWLQHPKFVVGKRQARLRLKAIMNQVTEKIQK